jgi:hypothetical protein
MSSGYAQQEAPPTKPVTPPAASPVATPAATTGTTAKTTAKTSDKITEKTASEPTAPTKPGGTTEATTTKPTEPSVKSGEAKPESTKAESTKTEETEAEPAKTESPEVRETAPPPPTEPGGANSWAPGVIGLVALGAGIFYGIRYAKQKGITVASFLKQLGVEMPQDAVGNTVPLKAAKPEPAPLPPLPSLADLPTAIVQPTPGILSASAAVKGGVPAPTVNYRTGAPRLVGTIGVVAGEVFLLEEGMTIGREESNTLALTQDMTLSRRHARIEKQNGAWVIADVGSSGGTFVNRQRIPGTLPLHPGDEIQMGAVSFRFEGEI